MLSRHAMISGDKAIGVLAVQIRREDVYSSDDVEAQRHRDANSNHAGECAPHC
jgi:hypothetical protein